MDLTSWIVYAILAVELLVLGFVVFWFGLRALRWVTGVTALILAIAVARFGLTHPEYARANLVDSFLSGVDQIIIALLHPVWHGSSGTS
jgi:predicted ferric reductase